MLEDAGEKSAHVAHQVAGEPRDGGGSEGEIAKGVVENGKDLHHAGSYGQHGGFEYHCTVHGADNGAEKHRQKHDTARAGDVPEVRIGALENSK